MRAPAIMKGEREDSAAVIDVDNSVASGVSIAAATSGQQLLKKGPWTAAEDAILMEYVKEHGEGNWNAVQKNSGLQRCGKSCRLRWANHLRPNLKKGSFSPEEEMLILQLHAEYGNKWARMAAHLPGRTDNEIKNYWNTRIKRRQRAGLPLYPPEIQQHLALRSQRQGQMDCFSRFKSSQSPLSLFNSGSPLFSQYSHTPVVLHNPNRAKNLSFQSTNYASPVQFGLGNYDFDPPPVLLQSPPAYVAKMELPSSQFSSNSCNAHMPQGNSGLLDALLEESHRVGEVPNSKCPPPLDPIGIQVKQEVVTEAVESANHDVSTLLDMIPMPTAMAAFSDWSNGPTSEATADGEIGIQLPQLSSSQSMAQVELDWGIGSSWDSMQWVNMPRIC